MPRRTVALAVWLRALALSSQPKLDPASPIVACLMMSVHMGSRLAYSGSPTHPSLGRLRAVPFILYFLYLFWDPGLHVRRVIFTIQNTGVCEIQVKSVAVGRFGVHGTSNWSLEAARGSCFAFGDTRVCDNG